MFTYNYLTHITHVTHKSLLVLNTEHSFVKEELSHYWVLTIETCEMETCVAVGVNSVHITSE
jgi:hypothetical protein